MDDKQILDLYWERSEAAISETSKKYGNIGVQGVQTR